ncbi:flagellar basal body P-ring formation chaperone FlgA [Paraburkholderia sp. J63]|uniref:flagellar basal body P-ring formation chaperone FlgA n=1 Tax=Paraburkholderia sp. J63 TaxID=2805434 RepID=UPI002ABE40A7|nr:flagellar basal body P-ring formation chaperone FlgA [Paraburkholderia sp. J63]
MPQTAFFRARRAAAVRRMHGRSALRGLAVALACAAAALGVGGAAYAQSEAPGQQIYIAGPGDRAGSDAAQMSAMLAQPGKANAGGGNASPYPNGYAPNAAMLARGAQADASSQGQDEAASQPGMITIPGPGERGRASEAATPEIVTIPSPGTSAAATASAIRPAVARAAQPMQGQPMRVPPVNASANPSAYSPANRMAANAAAAAAMNGNAGVGQLQRVNVVTPSSAVAPVVVETAAPAIAAKLAAVPMQRMPAMAARPNYAVNPAVNPAASASAVAYGQTAQMPTGQEDGERIRATALAFLQQQAAGLPGKVSITVGQVFPRGLAACAALEPFMPPGARMWGRTTVGVRCVGAKPWTLYVVGRVAVDITYYVAARQIDAGQTLSAADFMPREGDLASLPQTIITDPTQANGAVALARITAGLPLRTDMLRSASSVVIGQTVRVIAVGSNFTISSEGSVLNNAAPGQMVRVRTAGGQIISGVVKDAATVQVQI